MPKERDLLEGLCLDCGFQLMDILMSKIPICELQSRHDRLGWHITWPSAPSTPEIVIHPDCARKFYEQHKPTKEAVS